MINLRSLRLTCAFHVLVTGTAILSSAQSFKILTTFNGSNGSYSITPLVQGTDGNFYGTTYEGGANNLGTIFKMTPNGRLTSLYSFCTQPSCSDGKQPGGALIQALDGSFYGTTTSGGNGLYGDGTVFKITPAGKVTTLYTFCLQTNCPDGASPHSLVQATDGNFYGTTYHGGANGWGTVFKITARGELTTLYSFCAQPSCADGSSPIAGLLEGNDGNLYGTTYGGNGQCSGSGYCGTVFKITRLGRLTTLHRFCAQPNCTDGEDPYAGLTQGTDGNFYGTTDAGGTCDGGTVFKVTSNGQFTTVYSLCAATTPQGTLVRGTDGNFYGTTYGSGSGTIFNITPGGDLTTLYTFCSQVNCDDGYEPLTGLVQGTDGGFYGTTAQGGNPNCNQPDGCGTVVRLFVGLRPFVETKPTSGRMGANVVILGTNLTSSTSVTFNGAVAQFSVVSRSEIKTTVPAGATTGKVNVKTSHGTLVSNIDFRVLP